VRCPRAAGGPSRSYNRGVNPGPAHPEALAGHVERVTFHNPDSGFAVLRVQAKGHRELVTLVGHLASAVAGEDVEATGRWVIDKDHGAQFKADAIRTTHPHTPAGVEKYLGSGLIKGIGPHYAKKLVETFGLKVFNIIEKLPGRLRRTVETEIVVATI